MKKILCIIITTALTISLCSCVPKGQMCSICSHKKAVHQYKNSFDETIYACNDCYAEVKKLSE